MSIDTIIYSANGDGTYTKTITHQVFAGDIAGELAALEAQLISFQASNPSTDEITAAISNYQAAIASLNTSGSGGS